MAPMEHEAEMILGMGRGAMVLSLFGALWLGLSVQAAGAWTIPLATLLAVVFILLVILSWLSISRGKALRELHPDPSVGAYAARIRKRFRLICILEAAGIVLAIIVPQAIHRPYLVADWIAIVVGIHFAPLASLFRAGVYYVTAVAIVAWGVVA
jgi:hypothetical protein